MQNEHQQDDWDSHWNNYAESANLNPATYMRYKLILSALAKKDTKIERLLDIGSGQGDFLSTATQANIASAYTGFELSASGVQISRHKLPHAQFLQVDIFNPPSQAAAFENWATVGLPKNLL